MAYAPPEVRTAYWRGLADMLDEVAPLVTAPELVALRHWVEVDMKGWDGTDAPPLPPSRWHEASIIGGS